MVEVAATVNVAVPPASVVLPLIGLMLMPAVSSSLLVAETSAEDAAAADTASTAADDAAPAEAEPQLIPAQGSAVYDAVVGKLRKAIGEDGLDFV